ncbi:hypothetical protein [Streptomyces varsoviensis]|uniref:Uncharacterized protein n=1 Tax=Streptomyces varsoviensis TaxID=67373 RepID=A0ABR5IXV7_9ACTN|nr:hypothetical protein [Streptomyces varsoviensis]KOG85998.1 hypothetical protein ADK38_33510 [Streptomyces varsoviensis]
MADAADVEAQSTARTVISEERYASVVESARGSLGKWADAMGEAKVEEVVTTVLAGAGFLTPPPEPEPGQCSALFPDEVGDWWQCEGEPGHDPAEGHDTGEWSWPNDAPEAIPPRA